MQFIKESANTTPIVDTVFTIVRAAAKAKQEEGEGAVVDATIGSLYDEENQLVAFESVFENLNKMDNRKKAKYASAFLGNPAYREEVTKWVLGNSGCNLNSSVVASAGGTGAVSLTVDLCLEIGQTLVIPNIGWSSYATMAEHQGKKVARYEMFDGDSFNLKSFKETCTSIMKEQGRLLAIINDPCHNPTGYSLTREEWQEIISFLNEMSVLGPVVLLNDIAYIDYSYNLDTVRSYMKEFNNISSNVMVVVAFSCSKLMTSYGLRCGAALLLSNNEEQLAITEASYEKATRAIWSNVNNSAMENFAEIATLHRDEFLAEKAKYIDYLVQRSSIFVKEAKEVNLPIYPYKEGFFVTLKCDNDCRDKLHEAMMKEHIYTVKVNQGIRIAVCSLPIEKCKGLAKRIKTIWDGIE